ncbi:hypothetical protein NIES2098_70360 [Calothrix sp. NIES-2098]|nr:hypothetical protein NIES2098_70360 [Calothrix sp. NIES-2098]
MVPRVTKESYCLYIYDEKDDSGLHQNESYFLFLDTQNHPKPSKSARGLKVSI